jgi:tellurite resistance protein
MNIPATEASTADSLIAICLFASFSDGEKSDAEREQIGRMAEDLGSSNLAGITRQILMGKV